MFKYHGTDKYEENHLHNDLKNYFEGWYFKLVQKNNIIAFIPGISIDNRGNRHPFIQIITNKESINFVFSYKDYYFNRKPPVLKIGSNKFSENGIIIDISNEKFSIKGKIKFGKLLPLRYNIMGIFTNVPLMECKHDIISLHHSLNGELCINNKIISFDNGTGYIESDRGCSFPKSYLWTQCNCFDTGDICSIVAATAVIPFLGFNFKGCICIVYYNGREYRLATYLGVRILKQGSRYLCLKQGKYILMISLIKDNPQELLAPKSGNMSLIIHESVSCRVRYRFYINKAQVFDYISEYAGFEYVDNSVKNKFSCP